MRMTAFFMIGSLFDSPRLPGGWRPGCDQDHGMLFLAAGTSQTGKPAGNICGIIPKAGGDDALPSV